MERQYRSLPEAFLVGELTQKLLNKNSPAPYLHNEFKILSDLFAQLSGLGVQIGLIKRIVCQNLL